jgi:hypothetical protein
MSVVAAFAATTLIMMIYDVLSKHVGTVKVF